MKLIVALLFTALLPMAAGADANTRVPNCYESSIPLQKQGQYLIGYKDVAHGTLHQLLAFLNSEALEVVNHLKNVRVITVRAKNRHFTRNRAVFQRQVERQLRQVAEKPFVYSIECHISHRP